MKIFLRDLIIILSYLTSIPFWRRVFLNKPVLRVWCLHEVKDSQLENFQQKIAWVKKHFNVITPEQFKKGELVKNKSNLLLTFDDGYESWLTNVLPVLNQAGIKAIFFINESFRCHESKLLADGHSLGGHSVSHQRLTKISDSALAAEVEGSVRSDFFAYPFGDRQSFNFKVIEAIKKAGYQFGFTILPGFNNERTNPWILYRDSLDPDVPWLIFKLWLKGCYDLFKTTLNRLSWCSKL